MKYMILGHSGSGKSTISELISKKKNISILYLDAVIFDDNWIKKEEKK